MEYILLDCGAIFLLLLVMVLLSILDTALHRLSRVDLIVLAEQDAYRADPMFQRITQDALGVQLHLRIGAQFTIVVIAILNTYVFLELGAEYPLVWSFLMTGAMVLLFRQILPNLIAQDKPDRCLVRLLPILKAFHTLARPLALPVLSLLKLAEKSESQKQEGEPDEASEQEIQAYLDVGEKEGILEEGDSEMIQSVVEFGDTLVKEVMTPRTDIVGVPHDGTVRRLRDLMVQEKHSRIPVYRDQIDNIVGMVYVRHILAHCEEGKYETPISKFVVAVPYVPETKKVRELLNEMQASGAHIAIVVDEFGGVAGLVTMEDLLEVIVGEIRDEDEPREEDIRPEDGGSYWLSGDASLDRFEEVLGIEVNGEDCSTVSGLIIQQLGRVPSSGERVRFKDYQVEVLHSDGRRIVDLRLLPASRQATDRV